MSESLEFSDKYLIGIKQIDREHRKLFQIVGIIQGALAQNGEAALAAATEAVSALLDYTRTHFGSEEALMATYRYPELEAHRQMHAELLGQVHDMAMRVELEGESTALELSRFLGLWLIKHIQLADKRFGAFVAESEGRPAP